MSTPRETIAEKLKADYATGDPGKRWIIHDYPTAPAQVNAGRPVVSVWRAEVVPSSTRLKLDHKLTLHAYAPGTIGAKAEDALDVIFDRVMLTLERLEGFVLTSAKRQNFNEDTIAGWVFEGTVISENVYRTAVLKERSTNGTATA